MSAFTNPLAGIEYEQAWGPGGGTHAWGQNWQSAWGWDLLHDSAPNPVRAPFDGVVKSAGPGGEGRFAGAKVGIEGANGYSCFLTHMSACMVNVGDPIKAGEVVGLTGQANGVYHLHFAMARGPYLTWYTHGWDDPLGVDPGPFLVASAEKLADKGPKGYPLYKGLPIGAVILERPEPELPHDGTLRLSITGRASQQKYAGWDQAKGPLRWIAKHGLKPDTTAAIAWRGNVWRGPVAVTNVAKHLVAKYLDTKESK